MKAVVNRKYGGTEVFEFTDVPKPIPTENEVLVKVKATCINSWDYDYLRGRPLAFRLFFGLFKPRHNVLGCDISGIVETVGKNVSRLKMGDEVYGDVSAYNWGGFAEYAVCNEDAWSLKPKNLSFEESAAAPQAAILAMQGLRMNGGLKPKQQILINGAGGGVGTYAIQIAKLSDCEVTVADKAKKLPKLQDLGADLIIDCLLDDFTETGKRYDLILDNIGTKQPSDYLRALNPNGTLVLVGGSVPTLLKVGLFGRFYGKNKTLSVLAHKPNTEDLNQLTKLFEESKIKSVVDSVFSLEQTKEAFDHYASEPFVGKVVIVSNS